MISSSAHVIVRSKVRPNRYVIPRHEPQSWNVDLHVVMEQAATIPCWIVGRTLDHGATSCDTGHRVCKDPVRAIVCLDHVLHREIPECCLPIHWWQLLRKVELPRRANQVSLRGVRRENWPHMILLSFDQVEET